MKRRRSQSEYKGIQVNLCNTYPVKVASGQEDLYPRGLSGPLMRKRRSGGKRQSGSTKFYMQNGQRLMKGESCFNFKHLLSLRLALVANEVDITLA